MTTMVDKPTDDIERRVAELDAGLDLAIELQAEALADRDRARDTAVALENHIAAAAREKKQRERVVQAAILWRQTHHSRWGTDEATLDLDAAVDAYSTALAAEPRGAEDPLPLLTHWRAIFAAHEPSGVTMSPFELGFLLMSYESMAAEVARVTQERDTFARHLIRYHPKDECEILRDALTASATPERIPE